MDKQNEGSWVSGDGGNLVDMGGLTAIEGRVYTRPCRMEDDDVLFRIPKTTMIRTRYKEIIHTMAY